jgi:hypothetical protein
MTRIDESYEMVDTILGGEEFRKIKEGEEQIDNILKEKEECKEEDSAYQKFFRQKLEKYGVKSPDELSKKHKKEFFDSVDSGWEAEKETD